MGMLIDNFPDTFAGVYYYNYNNDDWMAARRDFYRLTSVPTLWFDGVLSRVGVYSSVEQTYNWYLGAYNVRHATPTDVTIQLSGEHLTGQTYRIYADVCVESGGAAKTMRIYMIQVLDHWPSSASQYRNVFKQGATTEDITLSPGDCQTVQRDFTFDAASWNQQDDIAIMAWAQVPSGTDKQIYQGAMMHWPFCIPADILEQPQDQEVCPGHTATFSVTVDPVDEVTYQWWRGDTELVDDGEHIFGATTDELMIADVTADDEADDYYCVVTKVENDCPVPSQEAALTLLDSPVFTTHPSDQTVDVGGFALFTCAVQDWVYTEEYQWRKDGVELTDDDRISGSQTAFLAITSIETGDAGEYDCVVTYAENGCSTTSNPATLTVNPTDCPGDLDGDQDTDQADLGILLADWDVDSGAGDLDGDGDTDESDLGILLADWGCQVNP